MGVVALKQLSKSFGKHRLLHKIDLDIPTSSRYGIIGPAACGKSVLLKLMCRLLDPDDGSIVIDGEDITNHSEDKLMPVRNRVGMLFQNYALFDFMTVGENVAFPLRRRGELDDDGIAQRVTARLKKVGLSNTEHLMPSDLSGGMKKRVGIARATIAQPDIVIYDEPTAGLDPVTTSKIYDLVLADQKENGGTVIAVSSDVPALAAFTDHIAMLYDGAIRYQGPSCEIHNARDPVVRQFVRGELEGPL